MKMFRIEDGIGGKVLVEAKTDKAAVKRYLDHYARNVVATPMTTADALACAREGIAVLTAGPASVPAVPEAVPAVMTNGDGLALPDALKR